MVWFWVRRKTQPRATMPTRTLYREKVGIHHLIRYEGELTRGAVTTSQSSGVGMQGKVDQVAAGKGAKVISVVTWCTRQHQSGGRYFLDTIRPSLALREFADYARGVVRGCVIARYLNSNSNNISFYKHWLLCKSRFGFQARTRRLLVSWRIRT